MAVVKDKAYSSLEPVSQQFPYHASRQGKPPPENLEKQVVGDDGKQVDSGNGKQVVLDDSKQVVLDDGEQGSVDRYQFEKFTRWDPDIHDVNSHSTPSHNSWKSKRLLLIGAGAILLIIILAAVLGGVLGSRHKSSSTTAPTSPSNLSASSPPAIPPQRNIAALSFTTNFVNNTRLYFQDDAGQITEAGNSETNTIWSIKGTGIDGKNGSAIAAAVSRPGFPLMIRIFYLDNSNIIHDASYTPSTGKWNSGVLSDQGYTAMPNSSLSAMYNQCKLCANTTIIAFQDVNGFVQLGIFTSNGWTLKQLGPALEPQLGTGLALQPYYFNGSENVSLYYQKSNLSLSLAVWARPSQYNDVNLNARIYSAIPVGSPIAAASSDSKVPSGIETWVEILSLSNKGVQVNTWLGAINDWEQQNVNPSVMANSTNNERIFEAVAVTATGNAFGVVKRDGQVDTIEQWLLEDDMVDWSLVGTVDLGGAWG